MAKTYSVPGVSCGHCKMAIEGEVGELSTVESVLVDVDAKTVTVEGTASDEEIAAAVEEAGYEVATA